MRRLFSLISPLTTALICSILLFVSLATNAAEISNHHEGSITDLVLQHAEELQLSQHESWYALLHYKRETVSQRYISQADDKDFFLHENGKTDAHAELTADIKAFFRGAQSSHAQCLFPARWWWLKQQLDLTDKYDVHCPQLDAFMLRTSHDKLFLVFPTMYLNNPGSTFGHTFLRFDADDESILLSQTLNYAARVSRDDDIVTYVSKGLFGGYNGFFKARLYYETVQEYSNIENRDIWEYQLDFSAEEIQQLVRHVWEVKGTEFDYYFFRENCAYRLLALLDVIRPGMQLTGDDNFPVYAIPVDTVRAVDDAGLIKKSEFRASLATQINAFFSKHGVVSSNLVLEIVSDKVLADKQAILARLDILDRDVDKLAVLEQSFDILQFKQQSSLNKAQQILQIISELTDDPELQVTTEKTSIKISPVNSPGISPGISPEQGHHSIRMAIGYGRQNSVDYIDLRFRPAFHDLLDAPQGYIDGAAINVFDTRLKWFVDDSSNENLRLESLSFFNVTSLSPLRRWHKPVSWTLDIRTDRTQLSSTQSVSNFISRGGAGFSYRYKTLMPYALLMAEWNLSSEYSKGYSVLLGAQVGLHVKYRANQLMMSYEKDEAVSGFELNRSITQLQWQYNLQVNHAIRAAYKRTEYDFYNDEDGSVNYQYYF